MAINTDIRFRIGNQEPQSLAAIVEIIGDLMAYLNLHYPFFLISSDARHLTANYKYL